MPRRNANVTSDDEKLKKEKCPECKGKGTITEMVMRAAPTGVAYEYSGDAQPAEKITRTCTRCGGRGHIEFYRDRPVAS